MKEKHLAAIAITIGALTPCAFGAGSLAFAGGCAFAGFYLTVLAPSLFGWND